MYLFSLQLIIWNVRMRSNIHMIVNTPKKKNAEGVVYMINVATSSSIARTVTYGISPFVIGELQGIICNYRVDALLEYWVL
jgi:hypothetical protein